MRSSLAGRLEALADAYEQHGHGVRSNLLRGATDDELAQVAMALGVTLPSAYSELYRWSAGTIDEWGTAPRLCFRDMHLLPLSRVVEERDRQIEVYDPWFQGLDFRTVAPLATYEGSTLAVACGKQGMTSSVNNPVLGTFHEVTVYFDSIESMVETSIAWVSQPGWEPCMPTPRELEIWRSHNRAVDF